MGQMLIPYKGQGPSGSSNQNLLWNDGYVYVMDNHRAAMWCWLQHVKPDEQHAIIHIDRHYDTLSSDLALWDSQLPDIRSMSIGDYLGHSYGRPDFPQGIPTIRWDNYLSIYLHRYRQQIACLRTVTHHEGDRPEFPGYLDSDIWELPANFQYWIENCCGPWIVNIDLDAFYCDGADNDFLLMVSDEYIANVTNTLKRMMDQGRISVVTLCLTPSDYTPGWEPTIAMAKTICAGLGKKFDL